MKKIISFVLALIFTISLTTSLYADDMVANALPIEENFPEASIYVSPDGDDSFDGSIEHPFATINAAKEAAKNIGGNVTVYFYGGEYFIEETIEFDETDPQNVVYAAVGGETPIFIGSKPVTGWSETTVNGVVAWVADYPYSQNTLAFYKDGKAMATARYPEDGLLYTVGKSVKNESGNVIMTANTDDLLNFSKTSEMFVRVYPKPWDEFLYTVTSVNQETGEICLIGGSASENSYSYFFDNVFEALNSPGECYLDTTKRKVYYIPQDGDNIDGFVLDAGLTDCFINASNVSNITFSGITFAKTRCEIIKYWFSQGGRNLPNIITFTDSDNIKFDGCVFSQTGLGVLTFNGDCNNCVINDCEFLQIAGSALRIDETSSGVVPSDFVFTNNLVDGYGQFFHLCDGILIARCHTALLDRNTVTNGYYTAFSIGRTWEHAENWTDNITITHNHIYNIGTGIVTDMGAIYMLGEQPGTVVAYNWIHDLTACNGVYPDQGNSYVRINHNIIYNIPSGYGINMTASANDNIVENNIIAFTEAIVNACPNFYGSWLPIAPIYRNNVFVAESIDNPFYLGGYFGKENIVPAEEYGNLFFRYSGEYEKNFPFFKDSYYDEDPLFTDPLNGDFSISDDSPLYDLENFEVWDFFDAGRPEK